MESVTDAFLEQKVCGCVVVVWYALLLGFVIVAEVASLLLSTSNRTYVNKGFWLPRFSNHSIFLEVTDTLSHHEQLFAR